MKVTGTKDNNPQILIRNAVINEGQFRGIKIITAYGAGEETTYGKCGVSVNGANALVPRINTNEYHTYRLKAVNNVYTVSIDGEDIDIAQNNNTSPYYGRTGITSTEDYYIACIKNIKFKRL